MNVMDILVTSEGKHIRWSGIVEPGYDFNSLEQYLQGVRLCVGVPSWIHDPDAHSRDGSTIVNAHAYQVYKNGRRKLLASF